MPCDRYVLSLEKTQAHNLNIGLLGKREANV